CHLPHDSLHRSSLSTAIQWLLVPSCSSARRCCQHYPANCCWFPARQSSPCMGRLYAVHYPPSTSSPTASETASTRKVSTLTPPFLIPLSNTVLTVIAPLSLLAVALLAISWVLCQQRIKEV